ncbi:hypothetical protein [Fusobacterium ulcerans]|uniref:hypothetical protein n=1 Tax=Fusobacterium ulcerans TaxID=861 RepID=UPI0010314314|nr:hypothetical protein [Fusobacterium ulcerans]
MKNKNLILILLLLLFYSCIKLEAKSTIRTYTYYCIYGTIENGKVNRMGIPRDNISQMEERIYVLYGIRFNQHYGFESPIDEDRFKNHHIKFYNDMKLIINGKEYIIPKNQIRENILDSKILDSKNGPKYYFEPPVDIQHTKNNELIIDIGEIEILDKDGKTVKSKTKIPTILLKKIYVTIKYNNIKMTDRETLYRGWAEDFPEDLRQMLKK